MGSLGRVGRHTTALVGREVKRTFSDLVAVSAGLPDLKTHEAGGKDFANFN
jgi:hypothetical protein